MPNKRRHSKVLNDLNMGYICCKSSVFIVMESSLGKKSLFGNRKRELDTPFFKQRLGRISGILFPLRGDCHFSRPAVARRLKRPTLRRRTSSPFEAEAPLSLYLDLQPIRFTSSECRHPMRELLPRVFTLTLSGGMFLWHLLLPFRTPSC